jgi:hypothetical protein
MKFISIPLCEIPLPQGNTPPPNQFLTKKPERIAINDRALPQKRHPQEPA